MMQSMWQMWEGKFNKEKCNQIISLAKNLPIEQATVGAVGDKTEIAKEIRKSKVRWISAVMPDFKDLHHEIVDMFHTTNRSAFGVDIWYLHEMQFTEYNANEQGFYDWHIDTQFESPNQSQRKLSMVIQLSDPSDYEGGNLEISPWIFGPPSSDQLKTQGTVIVFPSLIQHRVTPVTKGTRYSLVAWMEGPKWR